MTAGDFRDHVRELYKGGPTYEHYVNQPPRLEDVERAFVDVYCRRKDISICDIGCGNGREALALYEAGYHRVWPVDLCDTMLEAARRNAAARGVNLTFAQSSAETLPFADGFFDVVIMTCNMYGHITPRASRVQAMREVARVLKPEGLIFMTTTSRYHTWRIRAALCVLDISRRFYNPSGVEPGDRRMSRRSISSSGEGTRLLVHWFYPDELPCEAREAGLETVCSSATRCFVENPRTNARTYRGQGWLVYVLKRPPDR